MMVDFVLNYYLLLKLSHLIMMNILCHKLHCCYETIHAQALTEIHDYSILHCIFN